MILESYAEVYSNQFTTEYSPFQLVHCRTIKEYNYVNQHMIARQPLSRVNVTGILRRLQV